MGQQMKYHGVLTNPRDEDEVKQVKPQKRTNCTTLRAVESWARAVLQGLDEMAYVEIFETQDVLVKRMQLRAPKE